MGSKMRRIFTFIYDGKDIAIGCLQGHLKYVRSFACGTHKSSAQALESQRFEIEMSWIRMLAAND